MTDRDCVAQAGGERGREVTREAQPVRKRFQRSKQCDENIDI